MKKSKICLKVLLVLLFLFLTTICNAAILYVATTGTNTSPYDTWTKAANSIQVAVNAASNTDVIIVGSSGTGHGTGTYTENIVVNKQLTIQSESGYSTTTVIANTVTDPVFYIASYTPATTTIYNVTIDGFNIYGATSSDAGVYLENCKDCVVKNNRCGYDNTHYNSYGIYLKNSNRNSVLNNIANNDVGTGFGIYIDDSDRNLIAGNECKYNGQAGIKSYNTDSNANTITGNNLSNNDFHGIALDNSGYNFILKNTIHSNSAAGIQLTNSSDYNRIYLNSFDNTTNASSNCTNLWRPGNAKSIVLSYFYSSNNNRTYMGNYWDDYSATSSTDGIGTDPAYTPGSDSNDDERPLISDIDNYEILAWYFHNDHTMYKDDPDNTPYYETTTSGNPVYWMSDETAQVDLTFPSGSWHGQICIVKSDGSAPTNGHTFTLQIGSYGGTFTAAVGATITGNGTSKIFEFATTSAALSVDTGDWLTVKLTQSNGIDYAVWTGGAWSYISSPGNGDPNYSLPVELSAFTAQYIMNTPTLYWSTQTETDNLGWYIYRNTESDFTSADKISGLIPGHGTTSQPQDYLYEDIEELEVDQTYYYWLESVDFGGTINHFDRMVSITIPIHEDPHQNITPPQVREMRANPNPFTQSTNISFVLNETSIADVSIYNIKGEKVRSYPSQHITAEEIVSFTWDGKDDDCKNLPVGIYLYKLAVNGSTRDTKRIILMR